MSIFFDFSHSARVINVHLTEETALTRQRFCTGYISIVKRIYNGCVGRRVKYRYLFISEIDAAESALWVFHTCGKENINALGLVGIVDDVAIYINASVVGYIEMRVNIHAVAPFKLVSVYERGSFGICAKHSYVTLGNSACRYYSAPVKCRKKLDAEGCAKLFVCYMRNT